jgi:hypothetical protein
MLQIRNFGLAIGFCVLLGLAGVAEAATIYSETTNGDISGNRTAPTVRTLGLGSNDVFATSQGGDQEYLTLIVPNGLALRNLFLRADVPGGFDQTAFIGMATGSPFPIDPLFASDASDMLGYAHFSPFMVGQDLFPSMENSFGSQGFSSPLPAGTYSFAIQQLGTPVTYQLDFTTVAVPEPASVALAGMSSLLLARRRRA